MSQPNFISILTGKIIGKRLMVLCWSAMFASSTMAENTEQPQRYIVLLHEETTAALASLAPHTVSHSKRQTLALQHFVRKHQLEPLRMIPQLGLISVLLTKQQQDPLRQLPQVAVLEPDPLRFLLTTPVGQLPQSVLPIPMPFAMQNPIKVCVVDSGYALQHADLKTSAVSGAALDDSDDLAADNWDQDEQGHGSHIAGIIAGLDPSSGHSHLGLLSLHIIKAFQQNRNWIYSSDLIAAIQHCQAVGAHLTNLSLGGPDYSVAEAHAFSLSASRGMLFVAAAGNSAGTPLMYPASYPAVMAVTATAQDGELAPFAPFHTAIDIAAPGVGILSAWSDGRYRQRSGTSIAAAQVSAVAAWLWSHHPHCSAEQIRQAMQRTATGKPQQTFGDLNSRAAFTALLQGCEATN